MAPRWHIDTSHRGCCWFNLDLRGVSIFCLSLQFLSGTLASSRCHTTFMWGNLVLEKCQRVVEVAWIQLEWGWLDECWQEVTSPSCITKVLWKRGKRIVSICRQSHCWSVNATFLFGQNCKFNSKNFIMIYIVLCFIFQYCLILTVFLMVFCYLNAMTFLIAIIIIIIIIILEQFGWWPALVFMILVMDTHELLVYLFWNFSSWKHFNKIFCLCYCSLFFLHHKVLAFHPSDVHGTHS